MALERGEIKTALREIDERLTLDQKVTPSGRYLPYNLMMRGPGKINLYVTSGCAPRLNGKIDEMFVGRVPSMGVREAKCAARFAAATILTVIDGACKQDWSRFVQMVDLTVHVDAAHDFPDLPKISDAASKLFTDVLGKKGRHTRTTVGSRPLPGHVVIEMAAMFRMKREK